MYSYTYLKERADGDFDHIEVDVDGTETIFAVVKAEDKAFPYGRPDADELGSMLRNLRAAKLAETDWMGGADVVMTEAQAAYRQALRDLPQHANWPWLNQEDWPVLNVT